MLYNTQHCSQELLYHIRRWLSTEIEIGRWATRPCAFVGMRAHRSGRGYLNRSGHQEGAGPRLINRCSIGEAPSGQLTVINEVASGTAFQVLLPITPA